MTPHRPIAAIALVLATGVLPAAELKRLRPDASTIAFSYSQMGVAMEGRFRTFTGTLSFDPEHPGDARVSVVVDLGSVDLGNAEADAEVAGKDWFDSRAFPRARFESDRITALGGQRYAVSGTLTIKGRSRPLSVPATFKPQGAGGEFDGTFGIRRGDFGIGEGSWSDFGVVANEVQVRFHLTAAAD